MSLVGQRWPFEIGGKEASESRVAKFATGPDRRGMLDG